MEELNHGVKGVGGWTNLKNRFSANVEIDDDVHSIQCYVISKESIDDEAIIGLDIIMDCKMELSPEGLFLKKLDKNENVIEVLEDFRKINYISDEEQESVELDHIQNKTIREEIKAIVKSYEPKYVNKCPIEMDIILSDEIPVVAKPKRMSPREKLELEEQVEQWLKEGIIRPSFSDFASQVLFVPKKDRTKRLCVDFRPLNKKVIKDRFPIPNLDEQVDQLQAGRIFSTLDLKNGYYKKNIHHLLHRLVNMSSTVFHLDLPPVQQFFVDSFI